MNEAGNLPINCVFLHNHYRYYVPFRLPSIRNTISQAYTLSLYLSVMGRVSPVPNYTFHTYRFLYTEGFFRAVFQFLHTFHGFRSIAQSSTPLSSLLRPFLTIRQNSLYVTVCMIARTFFKVTLSTRLAPCITTTHRV